MIKSILQLIVFLVPVCIVFYLNSDISLSAARISIGSKIAGTRLNVLINGTPSLEKEGFADITLSGKNEDGKGKQEHVEGKQEDGKGKQEDGKGKPEDGKGKQEDRKGKQEGGVSKVPNPHDDWVSPYSDALFTGPTAITLSTEKRKKIRCRDNEWMSKLINKRNMDEFVFVHGGEKHNNSVCKTN
jgi:hypothetical protein